MATGTCCSRGPANLRMARKSYLRPGDIPWNWAWRCERHLAASPIMPNTEVWAESQQCACFC